jgi:hypothetical protein
MNTNVYALAVSGGALYAGGGFTTAGTSAANRVAEAVLIGFAVYDGPAMGLALVCPPAFQLFKLQPVSPLTPALSCALCASW